MDDTASLESVYQDFTRQLDRQSERVNALDAKANFGLGSGTLLAAVTGLQGGVPDGERTQSCLFFVFLAFTAGSLILYWLTASAAVQAYRVRAYRVSPDPSKVWADTLSQGEPVSMRKLIRSAAKAWGDAECEIEQKVRSTERMMKWLQWQVAAVVVLIALRFVLNFAA